MEKTSYRVVGRPPNKGKPWVFRDFFSLESAQDFANRINYTDDYRVKVYQQHVVYRVP